ncbi:hypothetical protein ASPZODRAFT_167545 [Penicilliopsis zonata CBS 506.65]|uniref:glutathione transferase n=1 Tax=Penicilliopsis zonata CBS 506.65 TaxID=1073090 RepID=A0A1L9SF50_9EURO|nr:hypothetical protein ASPZODRAFT_167545 [Penicilliopsis zonata CBS 506.65]OJJ45826.1 hypothetical protein ASPZODRAFT_167545 [Penicilliopsis zonata CBS 506.65]
MANKGAKITLYWLEQSRSQRILWLLEELGLEYDLQTFKRGPNGLAPAELKQIHPLGKSPVIRVEPEGTGTGTAQPLVLAESGAIVEYLLDHFLTEETAHLLPKKWVDGREGQVGGETEAWTRYRYFLHYNEGTLMTFLIIQLVLNKIKSNSPFFIKPIANGIVSSVESSYLRPNYDANFAFLEDQLATAPEGGPYLCGAQLTAADILMSLPIQAALLRVLDSEKYPRLVAYAERLRGHEAYQRAIKKIEEVEVMHHEDRLLGKL